MLVATDAGKALTTGTGNVAVGFGAASALTTGGNNVFVGLQAGSAVTTGNNNTLLGAYSGAAATANTVALADGAGNVRALWSNAANGIFSMDTTEPALSTNNTMAMYYSSTLRGVIAKVRDNAGTTVSVEVTNERPMTATAVTTATLTLAASHRNRFTLVNNACVVTLTAYTGIVLGSEHEFMNNGTGVLSFVGSGVTIKSVGSKLNVTINGVAVAKYIAANVFLLCGSLE